MKIWLSWFKIGHQKNHLISSFAELRPVSGRVDSLNQGPPDYKTSTLTSSITLLPLESRNTNWGHSEVFAQFGTLQTSVSISIKLPCNCHCNTLLIIQGKFSKKSLKSEKHLTLFSKPLITTLFLASSDMSHGLSFQTWAAMLYSSISGSYQFKMGIKRISFSSE